MLVSLKWLKDYVDIDVPPGELAQLLTMSGLEVEEIKTIEPKFSEVRKRGGARLKATSTMTRKMTRPITSAPAKSRILR